MVFQPLLPAVTKRPRSQAFTQTSFSRAILNNFSLSTWLLTGALLQSIVVVFIPRLYAFVPAFLILLARLTNTLAITFRLKQNPYLTDALLYKVSPQIPNIEGTFSEKSANEKVVIFLLGAKSNHPLGIFAPTLKELGGYLTEMIKELEETAPDSGFLGASSFQRYDQRGAYEGVTITYWRSVEDVHRFAYGSHKKAWDWWNNLSPEANRHLGIHHELYAAEPGQWEALYANFQPTLLGATTYLRKGDKLMSGTVDDEWINPLMDARRGKLRSSAGRLGWQPESLYQKYEHEPQEGSYDAREEI